MKSVVKLFVLVFITAFVINNHAIAQTSDVQDTTKKSSLDIGADIMSRYVWRGMNLGGSSPSIQPVFEYSCGNFTAGAWGAFSTSDGLTTQEADLYVSYTFAKKMFTFLVFDYFFPGEKWADTLGNVSFNESNDYFEFDEKKTGHLIEATLIFNGTKKLPLSVLIAANVWGNDAKNKDGDNQYSTYIEIAWEGKCKDVDYKIFAGFTPNSPNEKAGEIGFYGKTTGFTNIGIKADKELKITDKFSLPLITSFIINPMNENIFLVFGFTL